MQGAAYTNCTLQDSAEQRANFELANLTLGLEAHADCQSCQKPLARLHY